MATNRQEAKQALNLYRRRWSIECLFADAKTRGLNLGDTRLRAAEKLDCLLVTLAITWAYRCATRTMAMKAIARKPHGRRERSWFRVGLDALRRGIINNPERAIHAWIEKAPRRPIQCN
ncbi:transposase [Martelella soudanensis]|uniref:transposase n=1 Tax=Martelella sp. NC20 TaxID=2740298 RepID=UPI0035301A31